MKTHRTKRISAAASLLAALALTASGCSIVPAPAKPVSVQSQEPQKKVADFDPSMTILDPDWAPAFGEDRKVSTPIATAGIKILSVMFDEHPEYTVEGFVPTEANWTESAAKLKPLVDDSAFTFMASSWKTKKELPIITSYRTEADKDGKHTYTYTSESGQKCTDSEKPYDRSMEGAFLTTQADESGAPVPVFGGNVTLTIHCKEGTTLKGQMATSFPMKKVGSSWVMTAGYVSNQAAKFHFE